MGEGPNLFELPYSRTKASISNWYHQFSFWSDTRLWIAPDVPWSSPPPSISPTATPRSKPSSRSSDGRAGRFREAPAVDLAPLLPAGPERGRVCAGSRDGRARGPADRGPGPLCASRTSSDGLGPAPVRRGGRPLPPPSREQPQGWRAVDGICLGRRGRRRLPEALQANEKVIELGAGFRPNASIKPMNLGTADRPQLAYRIARGYAKLGQKDRALDWLDKALGWRFTPRTSMQRDSTFRAYQDDDRSRRLAGLPRRTRGAGRAVALRHRLPGGGVQTASRQLRAGSLCSRVRRGRAGSEGPSRSAHRQPDHRGASTARRPAPGRPQQPCAGRQRQAAPGGSVLVQRRPLRRGERHRRSEAPDRQPGPQIRLAQRGIPAHAASGLHRPGQCDGRQVDRPGHAHAARFSSGDGRHVRPGRATLTLRDRTGAVTDVRLEGGPNRGRPKLAPPFGDTTRAPLYLKRVGTNYWFTRMPEVNAVYFQFNQVVNRVDEPLAEFAPKLLEAVKDPAVKNLIVDARHNNGGNSYLYPPLLRIFAYFQESSPDRRLFYIVGRNTFSAAQNFSTNVERLTNAIFVGEPTGSSPRFTGEGAIWFELPYSRARASISNWYHQFTFWSDSRPWISPAVPVDLSSTEYFAGRDPALEAVFELIRQP